MLSDLQAVDAATRTLAQARAAIAAAPQDAAAWRRAAELVQEAAASEALGGLALGGPSAAGAPGAPAGSAASTTPGAAGGGSGSGQANGSRAGELGPLQAAPPGVDQAAWARLPERLRRAIRSAAGDAFGPEDRAAINAYFRRLAEEDR